MTDKITTAGALRWMRDRFAGWLASVTVFSFLWLAVGIAVAVLFVWDGVWSRHQAPSNLDPLTFQGAGWVMRLWTVFALAGAVWCFRHKAAVAGSLMSLTWIATSLMTYGHALGFIATGQAERYTVAASVEKVETVAVTSAEQQISALETQKEGIRADRDADVAKFEQAITNITSDGLNNDHLADVYRQDIAETQKNARSRIEAIDAQILGILNSKQEARTEAASNTENVVKFDPLYILLAEWTDGQKGPPSDEYAREIAQRVGAFWAFLLEMIGGAGPALLYSIHAHAAERKPQVREEYSEDVPPGFVRAEVPEEEWDEMQEALRVHRNIKDGAKKGARTRRRGNKIEAEREYMESRVSDFMTALNQGLSPAQVAAKFGLTMASLEASYGRYFTAEEHEAFFGPRFQPEPEAEPPMAVSEPEAPEQPDEPEPENEIVPEENEIEQPEDDLEIPPEPKEYGLTVYGEDPPANDEPDEEAA